MRIYVPQGINYLIYGITEKRNVVNMLQIFMHVVLVSILVYVPKARNMGAGLLTIMMIRFVTRCELNIWRLSRKRFIIFVCKKLNFRLVTSSETYTLKTFCYEDLKALKQRWHLESHLFLQLIY